MTSPAPLRVVQWTTGNVARKTLRSVLARPELELVGCFAWSADKAGQDAALLCRLEQPCGVLATDDAAALLALRPDCVIYTPLHPDVEELSRILRSGANVVTTAEFLTGHSLPAGGREAIGAAAVEGGASIFGSGMNPGFAQLLGAVATGVCQEVRKITMHESVDVSAYASDSNMDGMGWGRPMGDPGHEADVEAASVVFADGVHVLAGTLGIELDSVECHVGFAATTKDLDLPGRPIAAGTVAGLDLRWVGVVGGRQVLDLHQRWVMTRHLEPAMPVEHGYKVEVEGSPNVTLSFALMPDQPLETLTVEDMHGIGMTITGLPAVNAVRHVVAARPGIVTYADIPVPTGPVAWAMQDVR
jgi:hypothetical protein